MLAPIFLIPPLETFWTAQNPAHKTVLPSGSSSWNLECLRRAAYDNSFVVVSWMTLDVEEVDKNIGFPADTGGLQEFDPGDS